jgi:putative ABC transport system substrate-binding protein
MKRRAFLLATLALPAFAQQAGRGYRVGLAFIQGKETTRRLTEAVRGQLATHGFVEGRNLSFTFGTDVCCGSHFARQMASSMLKEKPDAVLVFTTALAQAFQLETKSTPVVFALSGDPVELALVKDYSRPGGNLTGVSTRQLELVTKRFELLRQLLPKAKRVALFAFFYDPAFQAAEPLIRQSAARFGFELRDVDQMAGYEGPLRAAADAGASAIISYFTLVGSGQQITAEAIIAFARERRMVTMMSDAEDAALGGTLSYGTDPFLMARLASDQLARVLKGASPAELPVDQISRFELVVNLGAAKSIGLSVPAPILARADRVIE